MNGEIIKREVRPGAEGPEEFSPYGFVLDVAEEIFTLQCVAAPSQPLAPRSTHPPVPAAGTAS